MKKAYEAPLLEEPFEEPVPKKARGLGDSTADVVHGHNANARAATLGDVDMAIPGELIYPNAVRFFPPGPGTRPPAIPLPLDISYNIIILYTFY